MKLVNLVRCWHERLFCLKRRDAVAQTASVPVKLVPVTEENADLVGTLRGAEYVSQFRQQLALGDFGYYACVGDEPVAYGWAKHPGSKDYFFRIGEGCCYLCRFFVHENMRGKRIYPQLICALMARETDAERFWIAVERGNEASERGLKKVGFTFVKEFSFFRVLGRTLNMHRLTP